MQVVYAHDAIEQKHSLEGHPENRRRLSGTMDLLHEKGILEELTSRSVTPLGGERLEYVHPREYIETVRRLAEGGGGQLDADTYVGPHSFDVALASAGALVGVVEEVLGGEARRGMSLMRPPGHHALRDRGMGFCIFANVALAARVAQQEFGVDRVLVVDSDVHHGNGTEAIFYPDPSVAFFSLHQYPFYPGSGALDDTGSGAGEGFTLNVPLPPGVGDAGYLQVFDEVLTPWAERLAPELILVSAGYDAHWRDPLAGECVSLQGFAELTRRVVALADRLCEGRLALALEGGYDLEVLPHAILSTLQVLQDPGAEISDPFGGGPSEQALPDGLLDAARELHRL